MLSFYRGNFSQLWITLRSDEVLGELSGDYLEDYFGTSGQVSLVKPDGSRVPLLMNEVISDTPSIPHDSFTGVLELESVPNGHYSIQGRVRDVVGNYTIIGAVNVPFGNENVITLEFDIVPGFGIIIHFGTLKLVGGVNFNVDLPILQFATSIHARVDF